MSAGDRLNVANGIRTGSAAELAELFAHHKTKCARCAAVEISRPATLGAACLEGSRMFKDLAAAAHRELIAAQTPARPRKGRGPADELAGELSPAESNLAARVARACGKTS